MNSRKAFRAAFSDQYILPWCLLHYPRYILPKADFSNSRLKRILSFIRIYTNIKQHPAVFLFAFIRFLPMHHAVLVSPLFSRSTAIVLARAVTPAPTTGLARFNFVQSATGSPRSSCLSSYHRLSSGIVFRTRR